MVREVQSRYRVVGEMKGRNLEQREVLCVAVCSAGTSVVHTGRYEKGIHLTIWCSIQNDN